LGFKNSKEIKIITCLRYIHYKKPQYFGLQNTILNLFFMIFYVDNFFEDTFLKNTVTINVDLLKLIIPKFNIFLLQ
jgi:hypothetical protein